MTVLSSSTLSLERIPEILDLAGPSHKQRSRAIFIQLESVVLWTARCLVLASIVVCTWWFGGITSAAKVVVAGLLLLSLVLALAHSLAFRQPDTRVPRLASIFIFAWLAWGSFQTCAIPSSILHFLSPGVAKCTASFRDSAATLIESAAISLVPEITRQAIAWHAMLAIAFFLAAWLFNSEKSRLSLLITIAANVVLLAFWGIIQRSTGTKDLLPNIENTIDGSNPFASFAYKNSGGAAMLLGIAALIGLLVQRIGQMQRRMPRRNNSRLRNETVENFYQENSGFWSCVFSRKKIDLALIVLTDPRVILFGFGLSVAVAGIASSLSRGAWIGVAAGALLVVGAYLAKTKAIGFSIAFTAMTLVVSLSLVLLVENSQQVLVRVDMLDGEAIRKDDRWNHWPVALRSFVEFAPTGSGLGTYGYASLQFQENKYEGWYRQAHNQYLETAVESGIPGIVLLACFLSMLTIWIKKLLCNVDDGERFAWGALICVAVVGTAVQAVGDFVITTPGNSLVFLVLIGAASGLVPTKKVIGSVRENEVLNFRWRGVRSFHCYLLHPNTFYVAVVSVALLSQVQLVRILVIDNVLARTELPGPNAAPTENFCRENIGHFAKLSSNMMNDSRIRRRIGDWNELLFRAISLNRILMETNAPPRVDLWNSTHSHVIFATLLSISDQAEREATRRVYLESPAASLAVWAAHEHYMLSMRANPYVPQLQLSIASIAPLTGDDVLPRLSIAARVCGISSDYLFSLGVLANFANDIPIMNRAWSRVLSLNTRRLASIIELAVVRESEESIVNELFPPQPSLLIEASKRAELPLSSQSRAALLARASSCLESTDANSAIGKTDRLQMQASIAEIRGQWTTATSIYEELVSLVPQNASLRFRYAKALLQIGDSRNAWTQVNTATTLSPGDSQSEQLFRQINTLRKNNR